MRIDITGILDKVQKPARYIGGETNSVTKEWDADLAKVALCYPDIYEVGMSNLGIKILYHLLNEKPHILCERAFSPWTDMEATLKAENMPLFSLESKKPLSEFDIIAFSFSHQLLYTNFLNMLTLSNIPIFSKERTQKHPLVIAGGGAIFNPEPLADFIDLFLIGDGEEAFLEIVDSFRHSSARAGIKRKDILGRMSEIPGVYAPSIHTGKNIIVKRVVKSLDDSYYPTKPIVPFIGIVHDRIPIEIMRGCPNNCRFCQAKNIYSPVRIRSKETILKLAADSIGNTGYEEISLLSLSSSNYPHICGVLNVLAEKFKNKGIGLSVPSLRIEEDLEKMPQIIAKTRKTGLTFAPEAGSEGLRKILNKRIDISQLFLASRKAFESGWRRIKLYFMIGLPREKEDDLREIISLCEGLSLSRKETGKGPADITASVNAFIPKPHTPLQWEGMDSIEELLNKQSYIRKIAKSQRIKFKFHDPRASYIEALLSRGDRKLCGVLFEAYKKGARFDNWKEFFNFKIWMAALKECGVDPSFYTTRRYSFEEDLPWDHIHAGTPKARLIEEARQHRS